MHRLPYHLTVYADDGSSQLYHATIPDCSTNPFLQFEDFDAWARSTACSMQLLNPK
ncbi:MAG TPA: hypothetical protein VJV78_04480 [Polyangiales bacterium]|nr:hypothetical protein [Polyangiales bacterium]